MIGLSFIEEHGDKADCFYINEQTRHILCKVQASDTAVCVSMRVCVCEVYLHSMTQPIIV